MIRMNGLPVIRVRDTIFVPLPAELRRPIDGGCSCSYCAAHPDEIPSWDTLAISAKPKTEPTNATRDWTWTVHAPEHHHRHARSTR